MNKTYKIQASWGWVEVKESDYTITGYPFATGFDSEEEASKAIDKVFGPRKHRVHAKVSGFPKEANG